MWIVKVIWLIIPTSKYFNIFKYHGEVNFDYTSLFLGQSNKHGTAAKSKKPNGRNSKSQKSPRAGITDTVTKRMLSARRNRINELRNQSEELTILVNELKLENKSLKRQQKLQDKALEKYEGQENDMSSILDHHSKEINAAKEQTKRYRDKLQKTDKKLKDTDFELDRTKKLVKKLKDLVDDRQLQERDDLSKKLSKAEAELDKKSQRLLVRINVDSYSYIPSSSTNWECMYKGLGWPCSAV